MQPASRKSVVLHPGCLRLDCLEPKRGVLVRLNDGEAHGLVALTKFLAQTSEHLQIALGQSLKLGLNQCSARSVKTFQWEKVSVV